MTDMQNFPYQVQSDMAAELFRAKKGKIPAGEHNALDGIRYENTDMDGIRCEKLTVQTEEASEKLGKSIGVYFTVHTGIPSFESRAEYEACKKACRTALTEAIGTVLSKEDPIDPVSDSPVSFPGEEAERRHSASPEWDMEHLPIRMGTEQPDPADGDSCIDKIDSVPPEPAEPGDIPGFTSVLVIGLGNPELTPDALGSLCAGELCVTRHLTGADSPLPPELRARLRPLSAFCPTVLGQTGIETLSLVRGAVDAVHPSLVILIDALASSELSNLVRTVQISTTGIHPGGGIGNKRMPLTRETLGVPVLTVGVPTVISASTLVYRSLEAAGLLPQGEEDNGLRESLHETLSDSVTSYVAPKDIDRNVREYAHLLSSVINDTVLGDDIAAEWFRRI